MESKSVLFTAYFTKDADTQRDIYWKANDFSHIKPWHISVDWHKIKGVIFHDGLERDFIKQYTTANIEFVEAKPHQTLSVHMYRFLLVLEYLQKHPEVEYAFLTDGSDVVVRNNPFVDIKRDLLYVGSEPATIEATWPWLEKQMAVLLSNDSARINAWNSANKSKTLLNSGISGGHRDIFIEFLKEMEKVSTTKSANKSNIIDMAAINVVLYGQNFEHRFKTGHPIHSEFRSFDINNKSVYFVHK